MKRRDFATVLAAGSLAGPSLLASAQTPGQAPVEGKDYQRLNPPLAAPAPGKIEVIDFFWYGCPHCNAFGPMLDAWSKRLPADVIYRHNPVAFRKEPFEAHQRIYYALEEMKLTDTMHRRVFAALHVDHLRLDNPTDISAFMARNGVDAAKFMSFYDSFSVQTKARQAAQLAVAYKLDGVPAIGIQGKYLTSPSMAGSPERSLAVADYLIAQVRAKG